LSFCAFGIFTHKPACKYVGEIDPWKEGVGETPKMAKRERDKGPLAKWQKMSKPKGNDSKMYIRRLKHNFN